MKPYGVAHEDTSNQAGGRATTMRARQNKTRAAVVKTHMPPGREMTHEWHMATKQQPSLARAV